MHLIRRFSPIALFFLIAFSQTGCLDARKAVYFNNIQDTVMQQAAFDVEPKIQKSDLLNITVSSLNPEASIVFNTPNVATANTALSTGSTNAANAGIGNAQLVGYLVSQSGTIKFPVLGEIKADGLTKRELESQITQTLLDKKLLVDPIVSVRFLNFRVTVIGEVTRPTTINVANERISILEAIGLAGDLTIYGIRDNVLLIRENGDKKEVRRLNLNDKNILTSPYYYLKTNDVVYVEPRKEKVLSTSRTQQLLPIYVSVLSFITIILTYVLKK